MDLRSKIGQVRVVDSEKCVLMFLDASCVQKMWCSGTNGIFTCNPRVTWPSAVCVLELEAAVLWLSGALIVFLLGHVAQIIVK